MSANRAFQTCIEMFNQRNYEIVEMDEERILAIKEDGKPICAFIPKVATKFNVDRIQQYISTIKKMDILHCLVVYKDSATPIAKKVVDESTEITIELFSEDELQFNITTHKWVPEHRLLYRKQSKEAEQFKKKYSDKFPIILKSDPVARFYGYKRGDIIQITHKDDYVKYRICM